MKTRSFNADEVKAVLAALKAADQSKPEETTDVLLKKIKATRPSIGMLLEHSTQYAPSVETDELILKVEREFGDYIIVRFRDDLILAHILGDVEGEATIITYIVALVGHLVEGAYHLGKCDGCPFNTLPGLTHSDTPVTPPEVKTA